MTITDKTRKLLWGRSGNRCAFCRGVLSVDSTELDDASVVGDECHIVSGKVGGPRYDPAFPPDELDAYDNLLLLCRIHHKVIDDQEHTFTPLVLKRLKQDHEDLVSTALADPQVARAEAIIRLMSRRFRDQRMELCGPVITIVRDQVRIMDRWEPWLTERRFLKSTLMRREPMVVAGFRDAVESARKISVEAYEELSKAQVELKMLLHALADVHEPFVEDTSHPIPRDRSDEYAASYSIAATFLRDARDHLETARRYLENYVGSTAGDA